MARHIFTCLNDAFSPRRVHDTRNAFAAFLKDLRPAGADRTAALTAEELSGAICDGSFYAFMKAQGWVDVADVGRSDAHLRQIFEYGAYDIVGHAVISNLFHQFSNVRVADPIEDIFPESSLFDDLELLASQSTQQHLEQFYPRPIAFERRFGDREEIVIRSNDYGIKIVIQTLADMDHVVRRRLARMLFRQELGYLEDRQRTVIDLVLDRLKSVDEAKNFDDGNPNSTTSRIIARGMAVLDPP
jgi:hypothetical protein